MKFFILKFIVWEIFEKYLENVFSLECVFCTKFATFQQMEKKKRKRHKAPVGYEFHKF